VGEAMRSRLCSIYGIPHEFHKLIPELLAPGAITIRAKSAAIEALV
jgi:hypothetical protein